MPEERLRPPDEITAAGQPQRVFAVTGDQVVRFAARLARCLEAQRWLQRLDGLGWQGDPEDALAAMKESEWIAREPGDDRAVERAALSEAVRTQAFGLADQGDLDGALAALREIGRVAREAGDEDGFHAALELQLAIAALVPITAGS